MWIFGSEPVGSSCKRRKLEGGGRFGLYNSLPMGKREKLILNSNLKNCLQTIRLVREIVNFSRNLSYINVSAVYRLCNLLRSGKSGNKTCADNCTVLGFFPPVDVPDGSPADMKLWVNNAEKKKWDSNGIFLCFWTFPPSLRSSSYFVTIILWLFMLGKQ